MASFSQSATAPDEDFDARCARIRQRILDGIEDALDDMAQPDTQRATIARTIQRHIAPLFCSQATCRRARRCRRDPCTEADRPRRRASVSHGTGHCQAPSAAR